MNAHCLRSSAQSRAISCTKRHFQHRMKMIAQATLVLLALSVPLSQAVRALPATGENGIKEITQGPEHKCFGSLQQYVYTVQVQDLVGKGPITLMGTKLAQLGMCDGQAHGFRIPNGVGDTIASDGVQGHSVIWVLDNTGPEARDLVFAVATCNPPFSNIASHNMPYIQEFWAFSYDDTRCAVWSVVDDPCKPTCADDSFLSKCKSYGDSHRSPSGLPAGQKVVVFQSYANGCNGVSPSIILQVLPSVKLTVRSDADQ